VAFGVDPARAPGEWNSATHEPGHHPRSRDDRQPRSRLRLPRRRAEDLQSGHGARGRAGARPTDHREGSRVVFHSGESRCVSLPMENRRRRAAIARLGQQRDRPARRVEWAESADRSPTLHGRAVRAVLRTGRPSRQRRARRVRRLHGRDADARRSSPPRRPCRMSIRDAFRRLARAALRPAHPGFRNRDAGRAQSPSRANPASRRRSKLRERVPHHRGIRGEKLRAAPRQLRRFFAPTLPPAVNSIPAGRDRGGRIRRRAWRLSQRLRLDHCVRDARRAGESRCCNAQSLRPGVRPCRHHASGQ
jgi:hypothetical protein